MSITNEKLQIIKDNVSKVYRSGQMDVIKNANSLKGFESNTAMLLDDISPVTHEMSVKVRGKNLFNKSTLRIDSGTKNLTQINNGFTFQTNATKTTMSVACDIFLGVGTYYCRGTVSSSDGLNGGWGVYDPIKGVYIINNSSRGTVGGSFTITESKTYKLSFFANYNSVADVTMTFTNIQLELGTTATAYTPYVPDLTAVKVSRLGKNILEYPYVETTLTRNGITFTDNGDGTITANGTATADTQFKLQDTVVYPDNYNPFKYLIGKVVGVNGSPDGSSKDTYAIQSINTGNYGNVGYTIANSRFYRYTIFIKSGITVSNLVFKPMIYLRGVTNYEFEQYSKTDYTPTADGTVNGITSLYPNTTLMTDTDGVIIDCEYYKDVDKAYNKLSAEMALSGGE